jgi:muramidase (phage lysozyme)
MNTNIAAFLQVIRHCEGTAGKDGYRTLFGGQLFKSFDDHPRIFKKFTMKGKQYTSSAAGAYQFLARTWDSLVKQKLVPSKAFTPENQDIGAIALIKGRKALNDVIEGRFETALFKCNKEWASLPGSPYGQPVKTISYCKQVYENFGGVYMVAPLVAAAASVVAKPFLEAAFKELAKSIPTLGDLFGSGSEVSERNLRAVELAVNVVKDAVGATNEQQAVEIIKADPSQITIANDALKASAFEIRELDTSGISAARAADNYRVDSPMPFWKNSPAFAISALLLPLLYMTVYHVLVGEVALGYSSELKAAVISSVVTGVLGGIIGFWLGSSFTTSRSRGLNSTPTP